MFSLKDLNELLEKLPLWKRIVKMPDEIEALTKRIQAIEDRISGAGEICPFCRNPTGELLSIQPDALLGFGGLSKHFFKCKECGKTWDKAHRDR